MKRTIAAVLVIAAVSLLLAACADGAQTPGANTTDAVTTVVPPPEPGGFEIIKDGQTAFKIIRPEDADNTSVKNASKLLTSIDTATGVQLGMGTDFYREGFIEYDPESYEILVGNTNRAETQEVLSSLPENGYSVTFKNNKLIIVGKDDNLTALALIKFESDILKNDEICGDGRLVIGAEDQFTEIVDDYGMKTLLGNNYQLNIISENVMTSEKVGDCYVAQGAASDGTYAYFVLRNSDDTAAVINKHRLDTGELVMSSEPMQLGHGNDMTYNSEIDQLVVCTDNNTLGFIDPETLTLIRRTSITKQASGITYSAKRDMYAVSKAGKSLDILDGSLKVISSFTRTDKTGYTVQGMGSDEDYIYFIMSASEGKKDNVLVVYTWEGKYVKTLNVPVELEGESMFWVNDTYYIAYHRAGKGPSLYETNFKIIYS